MKATTCAAGTIVLVLTASAFADFVNISWVGPAGGQWGTAANWNPALVPANDGVNTFAVGVGSGASVNLNVNTTITNLSMSGSALLNMSAPFDMTIVGGSISNDGTVQINAGTGDSQIRYPSNLVLSGAGQLVLNGGPLALIAPTGNGFRLTNTAAHTIRGSGFIGSSTFQTFITNDGLIQSDGPLGMQLNLNGPNYESINSGTLRSIGSYLTISGGSINNTGGTITCEGGNFASLIDSKVKGGLLASYGTSVIVVGGSSWLEQLQFEGTLNSTGTVNVRGTLVNNGLINAEAGGGTGGMVLHDEAVVSGTGIIRLSGNARLRSNTDEPCIHGPNHTIQGGGRIGSNGSIQLINQGVIEATDPVVLLRVIPSAETNQFLNQGIMRAVSGLFILTSGSVNNQGGTITALAGQTMNIVNANISNGVVSAEPTGLLLFDGNSPVRLTNLTLSGPAKLSQTASIELQGTIAHSGQLDFDATTGLCKMHVVGSAALNGGGTIRMMGANALLAPLGTGAASLTNGVGHTIRGEGRIGNNQALTFTNAGTLLADAASPLIVDCAAAFQNSGQVLVSRNCTLTGPASGVWSNSGTVEIGPGASLVRAGVLTQSGGSTTVDGNLVVGGTGYTQSGGVLQGVGAVQGHVTATGGTFRATGLEVSGNYLQQSAATMEVRVGANKAEPAVAQMGGSAVLAGALKVVLEPEFVPAPNEAFVVLQAASRAGTFSSVICELSVSVSYTNNSVIVTFLGEQGIVGDLNDDGLVNADDLAILIASWGDCPGSPCDADLNGDGVVNGADLGQLIGAWKLSAATQVPTGAH